MDIHETGISPLGAVMSFLYSSYIIINAVLSSVLGSIIDADFTANRNIYSALTKICGIQFSVCAGIIMISTFIPRGAFAFNPREKGDLNTPQNVAPSVNLVGTLPLEEISKAHSRYHIPADGTLDHESKV